MSDQLIVTMIGSVGVPAAVLFFVLFAINKHLPTILTSFQNMALELAALRTSIDRFINHVEGEKP